MSKADEDNLWLSQIDLATVFAMLKDNGATEVIYKMLPRNANSKNQVYLAPDLSQLGKIPSGEVTLHASTSQKNGGEEAVFRSALEFYWIGQNGTPVRAPDAKLIFYSQYPEVRFSGFLKGCHNSPSSLYDKGKRGEEPGRILVLGIGDGRKVYGITLPPEAPAAREIQDYEPRDEYGVLWILPLPGESKVDGYLDLMSQLCTIHKRAWVPSTRLDKHDQLVPCRSSNCNGNTLESLLGIRSNGISLPDYRGWEIKARNVPHIGNPGTSVVTLFTPEPTTGVYADETLGEFLRRYGYPDTKGRPDRMNFGGVYRVNAAANHRTGLRMVLDGFDPETKKYAANGAVRMLDRLDREAMAWPFVKLMDHWKTKHAHAAFVPCQQRLKPEREYCFGRNVLLGEGAEFGLFLNSVHEGKVYYDPGIKLEAASTDAPTGKKRSQFRVSSRDLPALYMSTRVVDVCDEASPGKRV